MCVDGMTSRRTRRAIAKLEEELTKWLQTEAPSGGGIPTKVHLAKSRGLQLR